MRWHDYIIRRFHILSKPKYLKILEKCAHWTTQIAIEKYMNMSRGSISLYLSSLMVSELVERKRAPYYGKTKFLYRTKETPTTPCVPLSVAMLAKSIEEGKSPEEALNQYNKTYKYTILKKARKYHVFDQLGNIEWYPKSTVQNYNLHKKYPIDPDLFEKTPEYDAFLAEKDNYDELDFIKEGL